MKRKYHLTVTISALTLLGLAQGAILAQDPVFFNAYAEYARKSLAQPFKGVTTDGEVLPGLFPIRKTGVPTGKVVDTAKALLTSLSEEQRKKTVFPVDDSEWRKWSNMDHYFIRDGIELGEMNKEQRKLALDMVRAGMSARGFQKARDVMRLNYHLGEINSNFVQYGEWLYWVTIMGEPSMTEPWGWQFDGHHVVVNYFVLGDQVVMTPVFLGSEPVVAESGKYKGTTVFQEEQDKGAALMASLSRDQQAEAIVHPGPNPIFELVPDGQTEKSPIYIWAESFQDNLVLDYAGIPASKFDERQKMLLLDVIDEYVGDMDQGHAKVKMGEVEAHLDETHFAWIGSTEAGSTFYYRIQSPVILIEFDHCPPVGLGRSNVPTRKHIHTIVRTPNGNDYGKALLRQHYERHHTHNKN